MSDRHSRPIAYLDSNVFIYFVEGHHSFFEPAQRLFREFYGKGEVFVTSELTIAEVFAPSSNRAPIDEARRSDYLRLLTSNAVTRLVPITRAILFSTTELRHQTRHKLLDAIHVTTALSTGCQFFVSHDQGMRRLPEQLEWIDVSERGVTRVLEASRD